MKKILFLLSVLCLSLVMTTSCEHKKPTHVKVHIYKQESSVVDDDFSNDLIYWYVIFNGNGCYYTSTTTPITNYSSINWSTSSSVPYAISDKNPNANQLEELSPENVEISELPSEIQADIENDADSYEGDDDSNANDADSYEGDSNDSSGDSYEGDSDGGGDSGGGDSGGDSGGGE